MKLQGDVHAECELLKGGCKARRRSNCFLLHEDVWMQSCIEIHQHDPSSPSMSGPFLPFLTVGSATIYPYCIARYRTTQLHYVAQASLCTTHTHPKGLSCSNSVRDRLRFLSDVLLQVLLHFPSVLCLLSRVFLVLLFLQLLHSKSTSTSASPSSIRPLPF